MTVSMRWLRFLSRLICVVFKTQEKRAAGHAYVPPRLLAAKVRSEDTIAWARRPVAEAGLAALARLSSAGDELYWLVEEASPILPYSLGSPTSLCSPGIIIINNASISLEAKSSHERGHQAHRRDAYRWCGRGGS